MRKRPPAAKALDKVLSGTLELRSLLNAAKRLDHLQALLDTQLEANLRPHCKLAQWHNGTLLLVLDNGQWASRLHYLQRRLLRSLQALPEFAGLERIVFKVQPLTAWQPPRGQSRSLSVQAGADLRCAAQGISDPKLKAALERLAAHAEKDS